MMTTPTAKPRRPRPLKADQLWAGYLKPLSAMRVRMDKLAGADPEMAAIAKEVDEVRRKLWALRDKRKLAENQAKDRGVVCWTVFHPSGRSIWERQKVVIRTPHTIVTQHEFLTIKDRDPQTASPDDVLKDLERELHRHPLDEAGLKAFREHAAYVDESWRKFKARGGPEQEAA